MNPEETVAVETTENVDTQVEETVKVFTQEEVNDIVERRVSRERKAFEKQLEEKLDEAEKLRQMNDVQRAQHELSQKETEIAELKAELTRNKLKTEATTMLSSHGIVANEEVLAYVVRESAEATQSAVNDFVNLMNQQVEAKVTELLSGRTPKQLHHDGTSITKEQFDSMSPGERMALYTSNRALYDQLK